MKSTSVQDLIAVIEILKQRGELKLAAHMQKEVTAFSIKRTVMQGASKAIAKIRELSGRLAEKIRGLVAKARDFRENGREVPDALKNRINSMRKKAEGLNERRKRMSKK